MAMPIEPRTVGMGASSPHPQVLMSALDRAHNTMGATRGLCLDMLSIINALIGELPPRQPKPEKDSGSPFGGEMGRLERHAAELDDLLDLTSSELTRLRSAGIEAK